jgi:hypothetical protein
MNEPIRPRRLQRHSDDRLVTVCAACLRASCWLGECSCDNYRAAGNTRRTVRELRELDREDPSYWAQGRKYG